MQIQNMKEILWTLENGKIRITRHLTSHSEAITQELSAQKHHWLETVDTLQLAIEDLKAGGSYEGQEGSDKIETLERTLRFLNNELKRILALYEA